MRRLGSFYILGSKEYWALQEEIATLKMEKEALLFDAEPQYQRDRELLRFRIREEALAEKLNKAPNLSPNNWDLIYKPWLENLREYFTSDTKIT